MIREAFIITFGDDFVHALFGTWRDAATVIVNNGHGGWQGDYLYFDGGYDIEKVTVH